jgi:hypothetical protein
VLDGYQRAEEPELAHALDQRVRVGVGVVEIGGDRLDLALHEVADGGDDRMARAGVSGGGHGNSAPRGGVAPA